MADGSTRHRVVLDGYGTLWGFIREDAQTIILRPHARTVLAELARDYELVLWTTATRATLDRILAQFPFLAGSISAIITRENAPADGGTFLTPQGRLDRISKNILLIGGEVLVDDSDTAAAEAAAFGFPLVRPPSFFGNTAADRPALDADDWLLGLPALLREQFSNSAIQHFGGTGDEDGKTVGDQRGSAAAGERP